MSTTPAALDVRDLSLRFGAVQALEGVTFTVAPGEVFAVIGPNGAGKSSLFNLLTRTYQPAGGTVSCFGRDLLGMRTHQLASLGVARTFQNVGLFAPLSALDNVMVGLTTHTRAGWLSGGLRLARARREEREGIDLAMAALGRVGAAGDARRPVGLLPYGVQKRVEIARALVMRPRLLLLDEPVAGMSRAERAEVADLVAELTAPRRLSVLLVEHDMGVVMGLAQRVMVLDFGRPIATGTPAEIQADPAVIRAYLGEPADASGPAPAPEQRSAPGSGEGVA